MTSFPGKAIAVLDSNNFTEFNAKYNNYPYGVNSLEQQGYSIVHSDALHNLGPLTRRLLKPFFFADRTFALPLTSVLSQGRIASRSEASLSIFEHQALAYDYLRRASRGRLPPQFVMTCWLAEWCLAGNGRRVAALSRMANSATALTVFSRNQVEIVAQALDVPIDKVHPISYGIDTSFYVCSYTSDEYVFAAGNDYGRDWPTFLRACAQTPNVTYRVATRHDLYRLSCPSNVSILGELSHSEYREQLAKAKFVVVPVHPTAYPTGQSVTLEAYASGKAVVTAHTVAMSDYVIDDIHFGYEPGNATDLAKVISKLFGRNGDWESTAKLARAAAVEKFSNEVMWAGVAKVIDSYF